jgi:hypothetical protein
MRWACQTCTAASELKIRIDMITAKLGSIVLTRIYRHRTIITQACTRTRIFNTLQVQMHNSFKIIKILLHSYSALDW